MELKLYLKMLQKGWWLIVLGALVGVMSSLISSYFSAPQYKATARFLISPSSTLRTTNEVLNTLNTLDRESVVATFAEIMNSDRIFNDSIAYMQIDPETIGDYSVTAVVLPTSSVLELNVTGPDPNIVAQLANVIGNQTIEFAGTINFIFVINFLDTASPPSDPFSPVPLRDAGFSLVLGAVIGALLAILGEQIRIPLEAYRQYTQMDSASGVYNNRHFHRVLEQEINENPDSTLAVGVIELDGLKDIVDALPAAGLQQLLQSITRTLENELRGNDVIGRWNDISFSVILPGTPSGAASKTFERIYQALSGSVDLSKYDVMIKLDPHIGAAVYSNRITMQELIEKVESSLEQARRSNNDVPVYIWDIKNPFWEEPRN